MQELTGQVALITGGARGLGEAICGSLAEAGVRVIIADIRYELAEEVAERMQAAGCDVSAIELDVCDEQGIARAMQQIKEKYGKLDVLVNNAGTDKTVPITEMGIGDWDRVLGVNLRGPFVTSKYALAMMQEQGHGHIINIVSTAAKRAWANASAYHASKWGLLGFSYALHVEARQQGIKATAVVAGGMKTPFLLDRFPDIDVSTLQDPRNVADTIRFILTQPPETVIPEVMVIPMAETSWP